MKKIDSSRFTSLKSEEKRLTLINVSVSLIRMPIPVVEGGRPRTEDTLPPNRRLTAMGRFKGATRDGFCFYPPSLSFRPCSQGSSACLLAAGVGLACPAPQTAPRGLGPPAVVGRPGLDSSFNRRPRAPSELCHQVVGRTLPTVGCFTHGCAGGLQSGEFPHPPVRGAES